MPFPSFPSAHFQFSVEPSGRIGQLRRRALALCGVVLLSCIPPGEPVAPEVGPTSTLGVAASQPSSPQPFSVSHVAPRGESTGDPSVFVVFNRAVRPLRPDVPIPRELSILPAVEGHWEWVGSHGLSFVPQSGRLPRATSFEVKIGAGISSTRGETLSTGTTFRFQTPLPRVTAAFPEKWDRAVRPKTPITLSFSQAVSPDALRDHVQVRSSTGQIPVVVRSGNSSEQLLVSPVEGWPLDSEISFEVRAGFRGTEGPLPSVSRFEGSFRTYGPLTATVECHRNASGRCLPEGGLWLRLSNPVSARALASAIRASGKALVVDTNWEPEATTQHIDLGARLSPREKFTVVLDPIVDVFGQSLAWLKNRQVEVADYRPAVRLGFSGDSFLKEQKSVSVQARNCAYELVTAPVTVSELQSWTQLSSEDRFEALRRSSQAHIRKVALGKLNQWTPEPVFLEELSKKGPFAMGVRYQDDEGRARHEVRWGQRTGLGVTVKSGRDRAYAWVTRLATGEPVSGAMLTVLGASASSVRTDASGVVALAPGELVSRADEGQKATWFAVKSGDETAYRSTNERIEAWRIPVDTGFWGNDEDIAILFPERDLFRPGDVGWVKGYVRRPVPSGTIPQKDQSLVMSFWGPTGEKAQASAVRTNEYGSFSARLTIPREAALGYWTLRLERGKELLTSSGIQVAEYRPSEFEVDVRSAAAEVTAGKRIDWSVQGNYYFGGPMSEAKVETSLRRERTTYAVPGFEGFVVDDQAWQNLEPYRPYEVYLDSKNGTLSADGSWALSTSSALSHQVGPERLEFEATVMDLSAQTVSARTSVLVHPAAFYPAIEPLPSSLVDASTSVSPRVFAVTPQGKSVSNRNVDLSLFRVRWTHVRQAGSGEASATTSEPVKDFVGRCALKSTASGATCSLKVPHPGAYVLRASSTDEQGRTVASSMDFYAVGGEGIGQWRDFDEQARVSLQADRASYEVGQTARILIQSPFQKARAWITVERNGVLSQRVESLSGPSPSISIPITANMRPNAYVGVHLLEDRKSLGNKAHAISKSYRFGYAELRLDPEARRLHVDVRADRDAYRPRDEVNLSLAVRSRDGKGHPSEVALFVVDEGVLSLSGYQPPDPLEVFLRPRALRVETLESRESMARILAFEPGQDENKGDPGGGGDGERTNMLTAAYFNPSIATDDSGKAQVTFRLPDNIGRFRVMAVAVSRDDFFGTGRGDITVNRPLMIRPALPRFLRAGDRFEVTALIHGPKKTKPDITVGAQLEGLELLSSGEAAISLGEDGAGTVSFAARANQVGTAQLHFSAKGAQADAVGLGRPVLSPTQLETVALYGQTDSAEAHRLGTLNDVRRDRGGLEVTLASSALVGLSGGFEQLWDYPYLCSEQLASRALPLLALRDLAAIYGVKAPEDAERRMADSVAQLIRRQRGDGGFGMWPESPASHPWVSSYVLWVLKEAQLRGVSLGDQVFERGSRYLRDLSAQRAAENLSEAAFATFVLGRLGHADRGAVQALFSRVAQMSVEAQTLLTWAASEAGDPTTVEALLARLEGAITVRGNAAEISAPLEAGATMASSTRRMALALSALLAARPDHPLAQALVRGLLDARDGEGWTSTQDSAFALLALDAYRKAQEKEEPEFEAFVFLNRKLLGRKRFLGREARAESFSVVMKQLVEGGDLIFQQKGRGKLFYEARLRYAKNELPTTALESGFSVEKVMTNLPGGSRTAPELVRDQARFLRGDLVLVEILVVAPTQRRFVVIEDPIPAGLEAIDPNLTTSISSLGKVLHQDSEGYTEAWYRSELRDDRVLFFVDDMPPGVYRYRYLARATTAGKFVTPPTRALEMYQPEVFGRTAARHVEVFRGEQQGGNQQSGKQQGAEQQGAEQQSAEQQGGNQQSGERGEVSQ